MICFYPGPSKLYPSVKRYMQEAFDTGILEKNHRSPYFESLYQETIALLKKKLNIPNEYAISFVSSATECWEIIAQSFTKTHSTHIYNGAFGAKWFQYAQRIHPNCQALHYDVETTITETIKEIEEQALICLTQNETSNGTQISNEQINVIRRDNPSSLIAIDATSSMAGYHLNFKDADICYASLQKCFGLPAGMAILVCSPKAIEHAKLCNSKKHYNDYLYILENTLKNQSTHTPNILNTFLLCKLMDELPPIEEVNTKVYQQSEAWYRYLETHTSLHPLIQNKDIRSQTVITVQSEHVPIASILEKAQKEGFLLGKGYGNWKSNSFRIANFPAINKNEIAGLTHFFDTLKQ